MGEAGDAPPTNANTREGESTRKEDGVGNEKEEEKRGRRKQVKPDPGTNACLKP
jgi:hypothetical protein